jgi:hypothetical protein
LPLTEVRSAALPRTLRTCPRTDRDHCARRAGLPVLERLQLREHRLREHSVHERCGHGAAGGIHALPCKAEIAEARGDRNIGKTDPRRVEQETRDGLNAAKRSSPKQGVIGSMS